MCDIWIKVSSCWDNIRLAVFKVRPLICWCPGGNIQRLHLNPTILTQTAGQDKQLTDRPEDQNNEMPIHISAS